LRMSIDYQNPDSSQFDGPKEYTWTCPWVKCQHVVRSPTEGGLIALKNMHAQNHWADEQDYAKLTLTTEDRKMLKGIKIDPDTVVPEKGLTWE
jgi:hypothetical protein